MPSLADALEPLAGTRAAAEEWETGIRAAWPGVELSPERFAQHLAQRVSHGGAAGIAVADL